MNAKNSRIGVTFPIQAYKSLTKLPTLKISEKMLKGAITTTSLTMRAALLAIVLFTVCALTTNTVSQLQPEQDPITEITQARGDVDPASFDEKIALQANPLLQLSGLTAPIGKTDDAF